MAKKQHFVNKYGHQISVLLGIILVGIGLIAQLRGIDSFKYYSGRHDQVFDSPVYIIYLLAGLVILLFFKKEWIFKKKQKEKRGGKTIRLKTSKPSPNENIQDSKSRTLDKASILKINKE